MPPVRVISRSRFADELAEQVSDPSEGEILWTQALQMLALLPADTSSGSAVAESTEANIDAYYDPSTQSVTVVNNPNGTSADGIYILAHEFTHALQDQDFGLTGYRNEQSTSLDSTVAVTALIEGEASVFGLLIAADSQGTSADRLDWDAGVDSLLGAVFESIEASSAPLITAAQLLPYPLGTDYVSQRWSDAGQAALDRIYTNPPLSVLDLRHNVEVGSASLAEPLACYPTTAPDGYSAFDKDTFGISGAIALWMQGGKVIQDAWYSSDTWRGDSVVVFKDDAGSDVAVAWRTRWSTNSAAQTVADAIAAAPSLQPQVTLVDDREVTLLVGADQALLDAWADTLQCGSASDLPETPEANGANNSAAMFGLPPKHHRPPLRKSPLVLNE